MRLPRLLLFAIVLAVGCARRSTADPRAALAFAVDGKTTTMSLAELRDKIAAVEVHAWDPYYQREKRYRALPLVSVLSLAFGRGSFERDELVFRAADGYAAYLRGAVVMEPGAFVAFEDVDVPGWEPIGPQRTNPGPFYVVWSNPEQANLENHPRPWQLQRIEIVRFDEAYPHTKPAEGDPAALRGYATYRERCFRCHAVNREGGRVGPDLNVPQNILDYRPEEQVRAYIRNPAVFRFGNMPPHLDLADPELDDLIAYLRSMRGRKFIPPDPK